MSPYSASKFGIEAVGDSLRREVSPWGIDVVVVEPGTIATEIWGKASDVAEEQIEQMPSEARRLYERQMRNWAQAFLVETGGKGIPPEKVGEVVHKAISSDRPKTRYLVGTDAKVGARLNSVLPDRALDRILRGQLKQPTDVPPE
jgi:NAD(P)-dependent dehydrogenase (short-subunit alcohol dehydrogenase family)